MTIQCRSWWDFHKVYSYWISFSFNWNANSCSYQTSSSWMCCWNSKNCPNCRMTNITAAELTVTRLTILQNSDRKHVSVHVTCSPWPHAGRTAQEGQISFCDTSIYIFHVSHFLLTLKVQSVVPKSFPCFWSADKQAPTPHTHAFGWANMSNLWQTK